MDDLAGRGHYENHERPDYGEDASPPLTHTPGALEKIAEGIDLFDLIEQAMGGSDIDILVNEMSAMAGGAVEGGAVSKNKKKNPTIFREEEDLEELEEDRGVRGDLPGQHGGERGSLEVGDWKGEASTGGLVVDARVGEERRPRAEENLRKD